MIVVRRHEQRKNQSIDASRPSVDPESSADVKPGELLETSNEASFHNMTGNSGCEGLKKEDEGQSAA